MKKQFLKPGSGSLNGFRLGFGYTGMQFDKNDSTGGGTDTELDAIKKIGDQIDTFKSTLTEKADGKAFEELKLELKTIKDGLNDPKAKEAGDLIQKQFNELQETVNQLKEKSSTNVTSGDDFYNLLEKALGEMLPKVKKAAQDAGETPWELSLNIKAAVNVATTAIGNASGATIPVSYVYQQVTDFAEDIRNQQFIINFLDNGSTDKAAIPYMDKLPTQGTMAITNEGQLKPLISVTFELRYSQAFKIAGRTKISEEALDDLPNIMAIIRNELMYEHDIAEQTAIFTKVSAIAPGFIAGGMAASTDTPSNYDAIRAAIYQVKISSKGKYIPNAVLVDSSDVYNMGATKDANHNYVLPPFVLPDGTKISGVQIIETNNTDVVPVGTFIVGDWRKLHRRVYKDFTVRLGQGINTGLTDGAVAVQSDFESNMYTMIGESRLHLWIYNNETVAFVKTTFAAVKTAIATV